MFVCFDSTYPKSDETDFGIGKTVEEALDRYINDNCNDVSEIADLTWFKLTPVKVKMTAELLPPPKAVKTEPQKAIPQKAGSKK